MVRRARWLGCWLLGLLGCSSAQPVESEAVVLRGFHVVDPATRSVGQRDVVVQGGVIVARVTAGKTRIIEGHGQFLMPALWDLKSALWGNNSTKSYDVLMQDMSFSRALSVQLYYGVAHVGVFGARPEWAERSIKRAAALELSEAELLYPDLMLCSIDDYGCEPVVDRGAVRGALDRRQQQRRPFVMLAARATAPRKYEFGLAPELLAEALQGARARKLPAIVVVDDWQRAAEVVELGPTALYGLPAGPVPDALVDGMRQQGIAYAPALSLYLELDRFLANERALSDPFLTATVQPIVLETYRTERDMYDLWRRFLDVGRARKHEALLSLERLAKGGVAIVVTTDAAAAGTFQGYASHGTQAWLERAGLTGWQRLAAATSAPAQLLGRSVGFEPGQAADFLALEADPLASAENLRRIAFVMRQGKLVDRAKLLPDLTRREFRGGQ